METTLYEILEVSENASKEVIEKAYKVLAKKYHPDLQMPENRQMAEQKMKELNDAYDVLSNDEKRKTYDEKLKSQREAEKNKDVNRQHNMDSGQNVKETYYNNSAYQNRTYNNSEKQNSYNSYHQQEMSQEEQRYRQMQRKKYEEELRRQQEKMQRNMQEQYENAYYDYLRSLGYRIKERWTWEKTKTLILTILIMIGIIFILWIIPPTHNWILNIYESNKIIKVIVDITLGIINIIFEGIVGIFESLFHGW